MEKNDLNYTASGDFDYSAAYDSCVVVMSQEGDYNVALDDPSFKEAVINSTKICVENYAKCYNGELTLEETLDSVGEQVVSKGYDTQESFELFKNMELKFANILKGLNIDQTQHYAGDLNNVIENSSMNASTKQEVKSAADVTVNSSIFWKQEENSNN